MTIKALNLTDLEGGRGTYNKNRS